MNAYIEASPKGRGWIMRDLEPLLEHYNEHPVVRALVQLIPFGVGGALDVVLTQTLNRMRRERATTFLDELSRGGVTLDEVLLESEDFVHAFIVTTRLALNTRRREKIALFARLFKNAFGRFGPPNPDDYEDLVMILDDLSYKEIVALTIMDECHERSRKDGLNDLQQANAFWDQFEEHLSRELGIPNVEVASFMSRIARSGCYELITGSYFGYGGGRGKLTPTFYRLKRYIVEQSGSG
jgi:hypothetical protein